MKTVKRFVALVLLAVMLLSLTACGNKLNGTYKKHTTEILENLALTTLTFEPNGNVTFDLFGADVGGTYVIEDGKLYITWSTFGIEHTDEYEFSKKGNSIFIGNSEYVKQ